MVIERIGFARWRSDLVSGGNRYDDELSAGLRALGVNLREHAVSGLWPRPGPADRERLESLLTLEREWLIGNIVASAAPELIDDAVSAGRRVTMLMHYFPADDPTLTGRERGELADTEARAVIAASAIVTTSAWAAEEVAKRYGRDDAVVAVPGVEPAPLAPGSSRDGAPMLLWLARLTPTKDPRTVLAALARVLDLDWTARLVGPDTVDASLSRQARDLVAELGLTGRVEIAGPRHGDALESVWRETDLLVHTSRAETYGMVVSEALARGIPSIVASGTGAVEAQRVGATFPPGDADALAAELRTWLTDSSLRERWRADAARIRPDLPTWRDTARAVSTALRAGAHGG